MVNTGVRVNSGSPGNRGTVAGSLTWLRNTTRRNPSNGPSERVEPAARATGAALAASGAPARPTSRPAATRAPSASVASCFTYPFIRPSQLHGLLPSGIVPPGEPPSGGWSGTGAGGPGQPHRRRLARRALSALVDPERGQLRVRPPAGVLPVARARRPEELGLVVEERRPHRVLHGLVVDLGPERGALVAVRLGQGLVDLGVHGRVVVLAVVVVAGRLDAAAVDQDRKSTRLNSSHITISYAVFCLKKKK